MEEVYKNTEPLLKVEHLKKYYPQNRPVFGRPTSWIRAADDISLELYPGETLGLVGESGCGKSTLGRMIAGLESPDSGRIWYKGQELTAKKGRGFDAVRTEIQMVFQDSYSALNPRKQIFQILSEPMLYHGLADKHTVHKKAEHLMELVGLPFSALDRYPYEFSGGQRQRIGIARALAVQPEFIVLDEPISALDVSIQAQIVNLLVDLQKKMGLTYLFVAHDLSMVKHISDRVAVLYLGTLVELTTSAKLYDNPLHPYTQALLSAIPIPDPEIEKERDENKIRLEGEVPSPINTKPGCRFRGRCKYAMPVCEQEMPPLTEIGEGHYVACHRCVQGNDGK